jgi:hypothetical protein
MEQYSHTRAASAKSQAENKKNATIKHAATAISYHLILIASRRNYTPGLLTMLLIIMRIY